MCVYICDENISVFIYILTSKYYNYSNFKNNSIFINITKMSPFHILMYMTKLKTLTCLRFINMMINALPNQISDNPLIMIIIDDIE